MYKKVVFRKTIIAYYIISIFALLCESVVAQDCRVAGESCSDDKSCCGGCCLDTVCKETYMDCRTAGLPLDDPCLDTYCPPEEICYTYQPPACKGCGPITACRSTDYIPEERISHDNTPNPKNGDNKVLCTNNSVYFIILLFVYMF